MTRFAPDNERQKPFQESISAAAAAAMEESGQEVMDGPICLCVRVFLQRPKGHYSKSKSGGLLPSAPARPAKRPDTLKVVRAIEDALNGVVYRDDSQIVAHSLAKYYADQEFVEIEIYKETSLGL